MIKTWYLGLMLMLAADLSLFAEATTYSAAIGANFFEYSRNALETGLGIVIPLQEGLSFEAKAAYAVQPSEGDAFMAVPLQGGVRFSFGGDPFAFHCSLGLEPVFVLNPDSFRMGPYLGLEVSRRVHPYLHLFLGIEQALLFGGPDYVSTGTRAAGGFRFSFTD